MHLKSHKLHVELGVTHLRAVTIVHWFEMNVKIVISIKFLNFWPFAFPWHLTLCTDRYPYVHKLAHKLVHKLYSPIICTNCASHAISSIFGNYQWCNKLLHTVDSRYYVDGLLRYFGYYVGNSKHQTISYINLYKLLLHCSKMPKPGITM